MTHIKNVNVTNTRNVLVQIPSYIVAQWQLNTDSMLEVHYDEEKTLLVIKKSSQSRSE